MVPSTLHFVSSWLRHPLARVSGMLLVAMGSFSLARLGVWSVFADDFAMLSTAETWQAFESGLRFDLSIIAVSLFIPLTMLLLTPASSQRGAVLWQKFWSWVVYLLLLLLWLMVVVDSLYFQDTHRHVGAEVKAIGEDVGSLLALAWQQYAPITLGFLVLVWLSALSWRRLCRPLLVPRGHWFMRVIVAVGFFGFTVVAVRGGVTYRPISVADAFFSNQVEQGYLVLNGPFCITRAFMTPSLQSVTLMPAEQARERVRQLLQSEVTRSTSAPPVAQMASRPNVVILLLESWGATQVDAMRAQMRRPVMGATPNFDQLAQQGRLFTNFYANGQRSIVGISSLMTGLPVLPGMPAMGDGMEQFPLTFMGDVARAQGYQTVFIQSSKRASLRLNSIAARAGFQAYLGAEDIPELHEVSKPGGIWGTWDHNTLQAAHHQFAAMKSPFLGVVFTSTTHAPWYTPGAQWNKFSTKTDEGRALNSLYYADWALGQFLAAARKAGYYDKTIFMLLADHASPFIEGREDARNLFRIPFVMVGPGVARGVDTRISSQADLLPTLMDVAGWRGQYVSVGHSLMQSNQKGVAIGVSDRLMTLITPQGWLSHDLTRRMGHSGLSASQAADMEQDLFALYQEATHAQTRQVTRPLKQTGTKNLD